MKPRESVLLLTMLIAGCGGHAQPPAEARAPSAESRIELGQAAEKRVRERLAPPSHLPLVEPPFVREPSLRQGELDHRATRPSLPDLPPADLQPARRGLEMTGSKPLRPKPPAETTEPSAGERVPLPDELRLPAGPRAFAAAPDVSKPPPLPPLVRGPIEDSRPANDPARAAAQQVLFATLMSLRLTPAPFLRLAIPDPLENQRAVRLRHEPPEPVHVESRPDRPERPRLPVHEPAHKKK